MIHYQRLDLHFQLNRADWRAQVIAAAVAGELEALGYDLLLTSIERNPEETRALYEETGQSAPKISVHDVRPCRGIDGIPKAAEGVVPELSIAQVGPKIEQAINDRFEYPRGFPTCNWHDVQGIHWHLQVPWDEGPVMRP